MPYPKGIKTPEVRAAWIKERRDNLNAFDQLVAGGSSRPQAAQTLGLNTRSVEGMRRSVEEMEEHAGFVGGAGHSYIDLGLSLLSCLLQPGETLTSHDIAAWCGCSRAAIERIESRALRKVHLRLVEAAADQDLAEEMRARLSQQTI